MKLLLLFNSQEYYPSGATDFVAFVDSLDDATEWVQMFLERENGDRGFAEVVELDTEEKTYKVKWYYGYDWLDRGNNIVWNEE